MRRATLDDLPYILRVERKFCDLGFVGGDDLATHERQVVDPNWVYWVIEDGGNPAGYAILRGLGSANRSIELKRIAIEEPGQGLGRVVVRAILDKAFSECSAHRVWLDVFDDNTRARHVYGSLGFVEEGTMREYIFYAGRYRSLVLMSMLEDEYRARPGAGHSLA